MITQSQVDKIKKAVERYNIFHGGESQATIIKIEGSKIYVKFEGTFCIACGADEYILDLKYELEDELNCPVKLCLMDLTKLEDHEAEAIFEIEFDKCY
ncbi:MAG: hypothetical protein J7L07_05795 [Candidatus Odinarchaeota archaeon]|nr:hypothetical protein [Candidatus Odinarchaeota archaeon]